MKMIETAETKHRELLYDWIRVRGSRSLMQHDKNIAQRRIKEIEPFLEYSEGDSNNLFKSNKKLMKEFSELKKQIEIWKGAILDRTEKVEKIEIEIKEIEKEHPELKFYRWWKWDNER